MPVSREAGRRQPHKSCGHSHTGCCGGWGGDRFWVGRCRCDSGWTLALCSCPRASRVRMAVPGGGGGHSNDLQRRWVWMGSRARHVRHGPWLMPSGTPAWPWEPLWVLAWIPGRGRGAAWGRGVPCTTQPCPPRPCSPERKAHFVHVRSNRGFRTGKERPLSSLPPVAPQEPPGQLAALGVWWALGKQEGGGGDRAGGVTPVPPSAWPPHGRSLRPPDPCAGRLLAGTACESHIWTERSSPGCGCGGLTPKTEQLLGVSLAQSLLPCPRSHGPGMGSGTRHRPEAI